MDQRWKKKALEKIKIATINAPILHSPEFDHDCLLYTFTYDHFFVVILMLKDIEGNECHISFVSTNLQGEKLIYIAIDKESYVIFRVMKHFKPYILKNYTKLIVPHPMVRSLFNKK
jgi:hypothetical protein